MDNRSLALRYLSEAVTLDSAGNHQPAFSKYLQSLNVLTMYLNDMLASLGFQGMMGQNQEINQVLYMIRECSDRVAAIVNTSKSNVSTMTINKKDVERRMSNSDTESSPSQNASLSNSDTESSPSQKFPAFEKLQIENMRLLKQYQWRCERSSDNFVKTNLRLELERQLVENAIIAKTKFDMFILAVKQLQKERVQMMEKHMKSLLEKKQHLTKSQKEKQELYLSVFQYTKTETWTGAWKLNSLEEMPADEATQQVFQKTIRCKEHPLSQWLLVVQTNIKREIDSKLYSQYKSLPDLVIDENLQVFHESSSEFMIIHNDAGKFTITKKLIKSLQMFLETKATEITNIIETALEIFYLIYKSLLPEDSEYICHRLIEAHILEPLWSNFLMLVRISNISSEYKISQAMRSYESSSPEMSEISSEDSIDPEVYKSCILLLKKLPHYQSVTEKLQIMVEICQIICGTPPHKVANEHKLGADELMPLLCYVIVKSGMPQLGSECFAIEQLFDMNYMFGEEGYALATFLTALKYIEIRKETVKETD